MKNYQAPLPPKGGGLTKPAVVNSSDKFLYAKLKQKVEETRKDFTEAENKLWQFLRNKKLGVKFRRQHIIDKFIVDFYCVEKFLVIEIDGEVHNFQKIRDKERDERLKSLGCKILHFTNGQVIENISLVVNKIKNFI